MRYEVVYRLLPPLDDGSTLVGQATVPEFQFVHVCLAFPDASQKLIPLHYDPGVPLLVLEVGRVGLRNEDVQIPPPDRRGACNEFKIVSLEEDYVDGAHKFGGSAHDAVYPERLLERCWT